MRGWGLESSKPFSFLYLFVNFPKFVNEIKSWKMKNFFTIFFGISFLFLSGNIKSQCIWTIYSQSNGLIDNDLNAVSIGPNGKVIFGTGQNASTKGFTIYNGIQWKNYENDSIPAGMKIADILIDKDGMVWLGGMTMGLHSVKGNYRKIYHASDGIGSENVHSLILDKDDYLWIGTYGKGATKMIDSVTFQNFRTTNSSICDDYIVTMDKDILDRLYFGGYNGCFSIYDGTNFNTINTPLKELKEIEIDHDTNVWVAGYNNDLEPRVFKYSGSGILVDSIVDFSFLASGGLNIFDIETDLENNFYIATNEGLAILKSGSWTVYKTSEGLPANNVKSAVFDNETGLVWISTDGGAAKLESKGVVNGNVLFKSIAVTGGYVKVYKQQDDQSVKKLQQYDSVGIDVNGSFKVNKLTLGKYTLLAVLDEIAYPDAIPTYYGDAEIWSSGTTFKVTDCDTSSLTDINTIEKLALPPGNGRISGYIKSLDGTRAVSNPIKDVDVTLKKVPGGVVQRAKSNSSGYYEFTGLPNGSYLTLVDLPGLAQDSTRTVEITNDDTIFTHQDYGVDSNGVHVGDYTSINDHKNLKGISVYPNPASDHLHVLVETDKKRSLEIILVDLLGRKHFDNRYVLKDNRLIDFDIRNLSQGIYILRIKEADKTLNTKILVR